MLELKVLHANAIPRALERAERYRLLNEPWEAESICRDVLRADPENQPSLVTLLLALTDQFGAAGATQAQARELLPRLGSPYERAYYAGVICERWAKAALAGAAPGNVVYDWFGEAMRLYDEAEKLSPPGNEDAVLRWNACLRQLQKHPHLRPAPHDGFDGGFSDHLPPR